MNAIVILLGASLTLALCFLSAFLWSVKKGQFDDPVTPALRMLTDDEEAPRGSASRETSDKESTS
jgi:cbb3-type cytochrome oxidase maturation protein